MHMKISALNADFSSPSHDPLGSKKPAQGGVEYGYPPKKWLFTAIGSCSVCVIFQFTCLYCLLQNKSDHRNFLAEINSLVK